MAERCHEDQRLIFRGDREVLCSSVAGNLRGNMRVVAIRSAWENAGRWVESRSGLVEPTGSGTLDAFRIGDSQHVL
jgi:hypothetical protein